MTPWIVFYCGHLLIKRTHLTHMYGGDESLQEYNQHEQKSKYGSMRQGERELIVTFKNRFDKQVTANAAVGIAAVSESKRELNFQGRLDTWRYKVMLDGATAQSGCVSHHTRPSL